MLSLLVALTVYLAAPQLSLCFWAWLLGSEVFLSAALVHVAFLSQFCRKLLSSKRHW